jgi:hypothetical protein
VGVTRLLAALCLWDSGRLDADPRWVVVTWTGASPGADPSDPCWVGYAPKVSAEPDRVVARPAVRGGTAAVVASRGDQDMAVRWREGRRGLAVAATFPTAPSGRAVADVRDLLVRIAKGLR